MCFFRRSRSLEFFLRISDLLFLAEAHRKKNCRVEWAESRSRIFEQRSRRLGKSRVLPFATPYREILQNTGKLSSRGGSKKKNREKQRNTCKYRENRGLCGSTREYRENKEATMGINTGKYH